jgi:hypothetical protein
MGCIFVTETGYNPLNFTIMKKMMFLALLLSVMAVGAASANDASRRPSGVAFGFGDNGAFVAVNIDKPAGHKPPVGEYRGKGKFGKECHKLNPNKRVGKRGGKRDVCNCHGCHKHHPKFNKPHRPGTPPPPPYSRRF